MKPEPERFRPEPDTAENRARLAEQRERIRQALLTRNSTCTPTNHKEGQA